MNLSKSEIKLLVEKINNTKFMNFEIGSIIESFLILNFFNSKNDAGLLKNLIILAKELIILMGYIIRRKSFQKSTKGAHLITFFHRAPRIEQLISPVIEAYQNQRPIIIHASGGVGSNIARNHECININKLSLRKPISWWKEWRKAWKEWKTSLNQFFDAKNISRSNIGIIQYALFRQSLYIVTINSLLTEIKPRSVLTEYDKDFLSGALISIARGLNIPTFTLIHGVPRYDGFGYTPFLANTVLCWGEFDRQIFIEAGTSPEKLISIGYPRNIRGSNINTNSNEKNGPNLAGQIKPVALLGTNPIDQKYILQIAEIFCSALQDMDLVSGVIKIHPSERIENYKSLINKYKNIRFLTDQDCNGIDAIEIAEIVIVNNSGLGADALLEGKHVIVIEIEGAPIGFNQILVKEAECKKVKTSQELANEIKNILANRNSDARHEKINSFRQRFRKLNGKASAEAVFKTVDKLS